MKKALPYIFSLVLVFGVAFIHQDTHRAINNTQHNIDDSLIGVAVDLVDMCESLIATDTLLASTIVVNHEVVDTAVLDSCGIITNGFGHGSVVAIGPNLLLTAGHCLDIEGAWVEIQGVRYDITEVWASEDCDVGFVRIDGELPYVGFGETPNILDKVYLVGAPHNTAFVNTITKGQVCKVDLVYFDRVVDWTRNFVCDAMAWQGVSGGPVFNVKGQIVGIYVGLFSNVDNFSVCVPIEVIRTALAEYDAQNHQTN